MPQANDQHQKLILNDRTKLTVDGVKSIVDFSESYLTLDTTHGIINIEGEGMAIEELSKDGGIVVVNGIVDGIFFKKASASKGFFARLFK